MNEKRKMQLDALEDIKKKKLEEIFGKEEIEEKKTLLNLKTIKRIILSLIFLLIFFFMAFLWAKYKEYQAFIEDTRDIIDLGEKYKEELKVREEEERKLEELLKEEQRIKDGELKDLKNLNLENINNLPDEKKEVFLNIIPSGSPLKREEKITSGFGMRIHPISHTKKMHYGIDLKVNIGEDIISTAMGRVIFSGTKNGYGYTVVVEHMYGFQTVYAHLNETSVKYGEIVGKGKVIGKGGNSGASTGPHLHYEVRYKGEPIDPQYFVKWNKKEFNIIFEKELSIEWDYFLTIMGKN